MQRHLEKQIYGIKDSPFYRLKSQKKLAELLQVSSDVLREVSKKEDLYIRCWKHKKKKDVWSNIAPMGSEVDNYRPIDRPDRRLKLMQSRIANLLSRITPPDWLFSPIKGRSYVDNAASHKGARAFWLLDIANYFPSCSSAKVANLFLKKFECSRDVAAILVQLTTIKDVDTGLHGLPQGSPCSPILAFFSNLEMWAEIEKIVHDAGLKHSVYADDITISGNVVPKAIIWEIKKSVHKHGLRIKKSKETSLIDVPAEITGVMVVGDLTKLPNRQMQKLYELRQERHEETEQAKQKILDNQISGRLAQRKQVEQVNI